MPDMAVTQCSQTVLFYYGCHSVHVCLSACRRLVQFIWKPCWLTDRNASLRCNEAVEACLADYAHVDML